MTQSDVYLIIRRRAAGAVIKTLIGSHTFRATEITAYLTTVENWPHSYLVKRMFCNFTTEIFAPLNVKISSGVNLKTRQMR